MSELNIVDESINESTIKGVGIELLGQIKIGFLHFITLTLECQIALTMMMPSSIYML